ncbi:MAG TPA: carbon monoxide dehydrogenase subunit G [Thermomicrobiaceae bacterium]|nr:carbon monoxide dehydrogenase subunit G [Thermomicrobiaceae bacterium]
MKISGSQTIQAPRQAVWDRLLDPDSIRSCLPGVEELNQTGENQYSMTLTVGVGPVRGSYTGSIRMSDVDEPNSYRMEVEGSGRAGFVRGNGTVRLSDDGDSATLVDYDGDVEVGGPVGAVAQRMLGGVTNRMVGDFFSCIQEQATPQS